MPGSSVSELSTSSYTNKTPNATRIIKITSKPANIADVAPDGLLEVVGSTAVDEGRGAVDAAVGNCVSADAVVVVVRAVDLVVVRDREEMIDSEEFGSHDAVRH